MMVYKINIYGDQWRQNYGRFLAILTRNWTFCTLYANSNLASIKHPFPSQRKVMILINARAYARAFIKIFTVIFHLMHINIQKYSDHVTGVIDYDPK